MIPSPEQIDLIRDRIAEGGVQIDSLREDLVDHICCVVETEMRKGTEFDTALDLALEEIALKDLKI